MTKSEWISVKDKLPENGRSLLSWAALRKNVLWPRFESQQHSPKIAGQGNAIDDALIPVFQEHFTGQTNEC